MLVHVVNNILHHMLSVPIEGDVLVHVVLKLAEIYFIMCPSILLLKIATDFTKQSGMNI